MVALLEPILETILRSQRPHRVESHEWTQCGHLLPKKCSCFFLSDEWVKIGAKTDRWSWWWKWTKSCPIARLLLAAMSHCPDSKLTYYCNWYNNLEGAIVLLLHCEFSLKISL